MSFFSNRYPEITQKYAFFIPPCRSHLYGIIFIFFPSTFRDYTSGSYYITQTADYGRVTSDICITAFLLQSDTISEYVPDKYAFPMPLTFQ